VVIPLHVEGKFNKREKEKTLKVERKIGEERWSV